MTPGLDIKIHKTANPEERLEIGNLSKLGDYEMHMKQLDSSEKAKKGPRARHGLTWQGVTFVCVHWIRMVLDGITWYLMVFDGTQWYCMVLNLLYGIQWYWMILDVIALYSMVFDGIV